jgi:hypothetical protein
MSCRRPFLSLCIPALLISVHAPVAAQERFTLAGEHVGIYNLAGQVEVVQGSGAAVVVEVTRGGSDAARLRIEQGPSGGGSTLRVVYPGSSIAYPEGGGNTTIRVLEDGTFGDTDRGRGGRKVEIGRHGDVEAWADLRILVPAGRRVAVRLAVGTLEARDVASNLSLDTSSGEITAERVQGDLDLDTGSGTVIATGIRGQLNIDTGSGDVTVTDAAVGTLSIDTGSGSVRVDGFKAEALEVDTGSGDVTATGEGGRVLVDTGSGSVSLSLGVGLRNVSVDTGSGNVTVLVPEGYGARVHLETSSGDLEVGVPLQLLRRGGDLLEGTIGDGTGSVDVETGSGNISLRRR